MNTKEKFDDIKLSMLPEKTRETLDKIRKATKEFSIENAKATDYISAVHKKLKEEKPQSLYSMDKKPEPKKVEPKKTPVAKAKPEPKTPEPKTPEPTKTQIKQSVSKVNSLQYALDNDPLLKNLGKTDKNRDAVRLAMPRGRRVSQKGWKNQYGTSKGGRVYYENRENRTDRKSPEFKDGYPYLEHGGNIHRADSHSNMANGGYTAKGENYEYVNTFNIDQEDFNVIVDAYHENKSIPKNIMDKYSRSAIDKVVDYVKRTHDKNKYVKGGETERDCKANEVMKDAKTLSKNLKKTYYVFEEVLFDYTARSEYKKYTVGDKEDYDYIYDAKDLGRSLKSIAVIATYDKGLLVSEGYEVIYAKTPRFENGGEMDEDEGVDLFEDYDDQPAEVSAILEKYDLDDANYETLKDLHDELKSVGYTFEYGLDGYAYDLRKIGQKGKSEFYAKGGKLSSNLTYQGKKVNIISKKKDDNGDTMYFVEIPNYHKNGDTLRTVLRESEFDKQPNKSYGKQKKFKVDDVVYNKRTNTIGIVRIASDNRGETKTDADGNVNTSELEPYSTYKYPHQEGAEVAPSTLKEIDDRGLFNPFKANSNDGKYIKRKDIRLIIVRNPNKNSTQNFLQIDKSDFLDGLHLFEKGGKISKNEYLYIPRRDVSQVVYRTKTESSKIESKPKNGFWVRKDALIKAGMNVNKNQAKVEFENTNLRKSKSFGWVADTYTIGDVNGYVWKISTYKRGVELTSTATAGNLKDGVWSFMVFKDPSKILISNEESRITSAKVEKQHEQALKIFNEYFRDGLLPEKKAKGGELSEGIKTEMKEHGMSKNVATKTAKDHLKEDSKYYTKMKKAGIGETTKNKKVSTKPKSKNPSLRGSKSVLVIAKQIRKEGENWQDAIKRAKEMNK